VVARGLVSAVIQAGGLLKDLTVAETARYTASLFSHSEPVVEVLDRAGIAGIADHGVGKYAASKLAAGLRRGRGGGPSGLLTEMTAMPPVDGLPAPELSRQVPLPSSDQTGYGVIASHDAPDRADLCSARHQSLNAASSR
jgi:hypothetical protein